MYSLLSLFSQRPATPEVSIYYTYIAFSFAYSEGKVQPPDPKVNGKDDPPEISRGLRIGRMQGRGQ